MCSERRKKDQIHLSIFGFPSVPALSFDIVPSLGNVHVRQTCLFLILFLRVVAARRQRGVGQAGSLLFASSICLPVRKQSSVRKETRRR